MYSPAGGETGPVLTSSLSETNFLCVLAGHGCSLLAAAADVNSIQ